MRMSSFAVFIVVSVSSDKLDDESPVAVASEPRALSLLSLHSDITHSSSIYLSDNITTSLIVREQKSKSPISLKFLIQMQFS